MGCAPSVASAAPEQCAPVVSRSAGSDSECAALPRHAFAVHRPEQVHRLEQPDRIFVDESTEVAEAVYRRLLRDAALRRHAGAHVLVYDPHGKQRLRRPTPNAAGAAVMSKFRVGDLVELVGFTSESQARGSSDVGTVHRVLAVSEDRGDYRLTGFGFRWFDEVELESAAAKDGDDSARSTSAASGDSRPSTPPWGTSRSEPSHTDADDQARVELMVV